ncbi:hypothetical protein KCU93_g7729, partial [Aureobasidium melanogenum]
MSKTSTDTTSTTTSASQLVEKPSEDDMIISYTRHRRSTTDVTYTYQLPLSWFEDVRYSDQAILSGLKAILRARLDIDKDDHSIVWRMSETNQIAFVNSKNSFNAAVLNHKNANKKTIQLFVVRNDNIHCLPDLKLFN